MLELPTLASSPWQKALGTAAPAALHANTWSASWLWGLMLEQTLAGVRCFSATNARFFVKHIPNRPMRQLLDT